MTSTELEMMWGTKQPSHQAWWYHTIWLPNARKALRGERIDPLLLNGDDGQADEEADAERGHWGE